MELVKKTSSRERSKARRNLKGKKLLNNELSMIKPPKNEASPPTRNQINPPQASYTNISNQGLESRMPATSSLGQTFDGHSVPTLPSDIELDLLGLVPKTHERPQPPETNSIFVEPPRIMQPSRCQYHGVLPVHKSADGGCQGLDPMARWLAEGHTEQSAVLHLQDGQLSIHKECQCSDVMQPALEVEIEQRNGHFTWEFLGMRERPNFYLGNEIHRVEK